MTHARPIQSRAGGFTLLEVMLAVAVSAIVLVAVNTVFFGALKLRNQTSAAIDEAVPIQQALTVIKRDLAGLQFPGGGVLAGQFQSAPTTNSSGSTGDLALGGQRVSPDLYTASAVVDDTTAFSEVQKITYLLAMPTNATPSIGRDLIRSISRNLLPASTDQPAQQWLMGGVDSVAFLFFNGNDWVETWDSTATTNLPTAIKVQIALAQEESVRTAPPPIELVVPILVESRSNTTSTATTGGGQ